MAASPQWKVYNFNEYVGSAQYLELAVAMVSTLGEGGRIKLNHGAIVWQEGKDGWAGDSYDEAVLTIQENLRKRKAKRERRG